MELALLADVSAGSSDDLGIVDGIVLLFAEPLAQHDPVLLGDLKESPGARTVGNRFGQFAGVRRAVTVYDDFWEENQFGAPSDRSSRPRGDLRENRPRLPEATIHADGGNTDLLRESRHGVRDKTEADRQRRATAEVTVEAVAHRNQTAPLLTRTSRHNSDKPYSHQLIGVDFRHFRPLEKLFSIDPLRPTNS